MAVIKDAGIPWRVARTWQGTRELERAIKDRHNTPRLCPECTPAPQPTATGRSGTRPRPRARADAEPVPQSAPRRTRSLGRQASPEPEFLPVPDPRAPLPSVFPGVPAGREVYRDLLEVTDGLISGWRAELGAVAAPPAPRPGRPTPAATAARPVAEAQRELEIEP
jgi:hypothetical protein